MKAPLGSIVSIYYDGRTLDVGNFLRTPTGRLYQVIEIRRQHRGEHVGRQHLRCLVAESTPDDAIVLPLHWYKRG